MSAVPFRIDTSNHVKDGSIPVKTRCLYIKKERAQPVLICKIVNDFMNCQHRILVSLCLPELRQIQDPSSKVSLVHQYHGYILSQGKDISIIFVPELNPLFYQFAHEEELLWGFVVIVRKLWYDVIRLSGEKMSVTDYRSK